MKKVMMKTVLASLVVSSITVLTGCVTSPDMEAAKQPLGSIVSVVNVPGVKKDALYRALLQIVGGDKLIIPFC